MSDDEDYVTIEATFIYATDKAVLVENADGDERWWPRSAMHASTDKAIDGMQRRQQGEFKIMEWVAKKSGFV